MKIICNTDILNEALANVSRAVLSKSTIQALEGILIRATKQEISLCGYDLELGITTIIPAKVIEEGEIILTARLITDIIRRMPSDQTEITSDDKLMTTIKGDNTQFNLIGIPSGEYPEIPTFTATGSITMQQKKLKSMISQTIFAIAQNDTKPVYTGSLFETDENELTIVSVDGFRLAIRKEAAEISKGSNFIVPGKTLSEVLKILPESEENVTIHIGKKHVSFVMGGYTILSRLIEGDFLNYKNSIPKENKTSIKVSTRAFMNALDRVSLLITEKLKSPVRCIFKENEIFLSCVTSIGKANDQLSCSMTGDSLEIGFNNRYLIDALRYIESDEVKIEMSGPVAPMRIMPPQGENTIFLVLPVRLKND